MRHRKVVTFNKPCRRESRCLLILAGAQVQEVYPLQQKTAKQFRIGALLFLVVAGWVSSATQITNSAERVSRTGGDNIVHLPLLSRVEATATNTYYLSPNGNDKNTGTSELQAWATFDRALNAQAPGSSKLQPGDTLILLDGIYYQSLRPRGVTGQPGQPITVRAQHDGKAIIDGQGVKIPVEFEHKAVAYYYVIQGIVARNSSSHVLSIYGTHNVFRRVSAYNANTDRNNHVILIIGNHNLLEDCLASGTGRKMIVIFQGANNVIRRCFAYWKEWDGREWHDCWPWGEGIEIYNASNNIIENSVAVGRVPRAGVSLMVQAPGASIGNKILGTMSVMAGMAENGVPMVWGNLRPQPTDYSCLQDFDNWDSLLSGFRVGESGEMRDNLFQDILAWGNARLGLTFHQPGALLRSNNHVNRATLLSNGAYNLDKEGGAGTDAQEAELLLFESVQNSSIEDVWLGGNTANRTTMTGEGARLTHRYVNGVLMDGSNGQPAQPLWPWPMEDRIQAELDISVTEMMMEIIPGTTH
jgi:hypothetical protein